MKSRKGFTLVELIIVIVIIAILLAIAVPSFISYIDDAKIAVAEADTKSMLTSLNLALATNGRHYPYVISYACEGDHEVRYLGPKDNSVTLRDDSQPNFGLSSHHDRVKNEIREMMGGGIFQHGYIVKFEPISPGSDLYRVKYIKVYALNPEDSSYIPDKKPDVMIGTE